MLHQVERPKNASLKDWRRLLSLLLMRTVSILAAMQTRSCQVWAEEEGTEKESIGKKVGPRSSDGATTCGTTSAWWKFLAFSLSSYMIMLET